MSARYGWDEDVTHHLAQIMPREQAADLVAALKREHAHDLAEEQRKWSETFGDTPAQQAVRSIIREAADRIDSPTT
ncbi:hypothetical protein ACIOYT_00795 [Streptomyces halstedii]|uniref:hypothetical protein n=1 Tax=Streptomyces halstedii TaxID=1944 RepID=UPI00382ED3AC